MQPERGDRLRVTSGRYKDSVGTWDGLTVATPVMGRLGNVHVGRNAVIVSSSTRLQEVENGRVLWTEGQPLRHSS